MADLQRRQRWHLMLPVAAADSARLNATAPPADYEAADDDDDDDDDDYIDAGSSFQQHDPVNPQQPQCG